MNWDDAQEFCEKLREQTGKPIRLPTEAEWEYACRAGERGDYWDGGGEEALNQVGWYRGNSNSQTQTVGQKKANKWGLFDVHGNVAELCEDWFDTKYYKDGPTTDPKGPTSRRGHRVTRGGLG